MEIYFVRHGQTDWNLNRKWQGWIDIPLNAEGQRQAHARRLHLPQVHRVIASPLSRAFETARILVGHDNIETHLDLREINLGDAEGVGMEDIPIRFGPQAMEMWVDYTEKGMLYGFPNGESKHDLFQRMDRFLNSLEYRHQEKILVVTHGIWIRNLIWKLNQEIPEKIINVAIYKTVMSPTGEFSRLEEIILTQSE